ncbi:hypothetical protein OOJ09_03550 [Mesorhizobium qingshengii]|uniref:Transposase n=1 Tax=Mesorhizobium qingshengii TaxID=1165689 RepID=A0ABT4QNX6_9HYPH|nr:hypothetical protein [Mesorhizobium qingshengii]MCZ8543241.1 hypothetical protein [Mesorhizobium qingshengii]
MKYPPFGKIYLEIFSPTGHQMTSARQSRSGVATERPEAPASPVGFAEALRAHRSAVGYLIVTAANGWRRLPRDVSRPFRRRGGGDRSNSTAGRAFLPLVGIANTLLSAEVSGVASVSSSDRLCGFQTKATGRSA